MNATILYHEGNLETALKVLHAAPSDHLESMALRYVLDVLWCQSIKLIQVVSTSEFHEY